MIYMYFIVIGGNVLVRMFIPFIVFARVYVISGVVERTDVCFLQILLVACYFNCPFRNTHDRTKAICLPVLGNIKTR